MLSNCKILFLIICLFFVSNKLAARSLSHYTSDVFFPQIDSLIYEKNINYDMTQLDLLILYKDALSNKHPDSVNIFKKLAILNAELEQPEDAYIFTNKYISNTLDLSILKNGSYDSISDTEEYKDLSKKYLTDVNFLAFLYFYAALIGFFFTVTINLTKKANKYAKIFVSCFVGANSLFILEFVLYMTNYQYQFPHTYRMSGVAALLFGPLLYFYFKSVTQEYKFKSIHLLHFLPTVILLIFLFPLYTESSSDKVKMMLETHADYSPYDLVIFISKILSLVIYAFFIGKLLLNKNKTTTTSNNHLESMIRWKKNLYKIHVAYVLSYLLYGLSVLGALGAISSFIYHFQIGAMSFIVIYIAYMAYVQPSIFKKEYVPFQNVMFSGKYQKSGLTIALSNELKESLIKLLVEDKIYKENNINLDILAKKLNTTRHNASQIINEHFKMNFFELINKFRIEEAISLLKKDIHGNFNIIDVAYEVGYNNKVTFNKAFKKETSLTPSEFLSSELKNSIKVNFK